MIEELTKNNTLARPRAEIAKRVMKCCRHSTVFLGVVSSGMEVLSGGRTQFCFWEVNIRSQNGHTGLAERDETALCIDIESMNCTVHRI